MDLVKAVAATNTVPMRRSARTNTYVTRSGARVTYDLLPKLYEHPRFLMIPQLKNAERYRFTGVITHPFFKHGPLLTWQGPKGTVMLNRQLFYMMMTGRMQ